MIKNKHIDPKDKKTVLISQNTLQGFREANQKIGLGLGGIIGFVAGCVFMWTWLKGFN